MNITYLLGNGFDINIGLKTRYQDFYLYYLNESQSNNPLVQRIKEDINKNIENWSDLELALGKYTANVTSENEMINLYNDLADSLEKYLSEEVGFVVLSDRENARKTFINDICQPEKYFLRADKDALSTFYRNFNSEIHINIITLNYTNSIEAFIGDVNREKLGNGYFSSSMLTIFDGICHLHHKLGDTPIMGVNDEEQIANEKFRHSMRLKEHLIKPITNKMLKTRIDDDCQNILNKTDLFVLFGVSLGLTDKLWWQRIAKKLINTNSNMAFFEYNPNLRTGRNLGEIDRQIKKRFADCASLNEMERKSVDNKIYIALNTQMFGNLRKYIGPKLIEQKSIKFNYSNNDGRLTIGSGKRMFTTIWSKASNRAIHAYNDADNIEGIGLKKSFTDLENLKLDELNFTSRSRTPEVGDAIIWKNNHGYYAITKITKITDDSRGDDSDELSIDYFILK